MPRLILDRDGTSQELRTVPKLRRGECNVPRHLRGVYKYSDARTITMAGSWLLMTLAGASPVRPYTGRCQSSEASHW